MVNKENKLIFLLPPKVGSSSVVNWLNNLGINNDPILYPPHPTQHLTLKEICTLYNISSFDLINYKIIQITRNPFYRFISSYKHQNKLLNLNLKPNDFLLHLKKHKNLLPNNQEEFYKKFYNNLQYKYISYFNNNWGGIRFYYNQLWWNDLNASVQYFKLEDLIKSTATLANYLNLPTSPLPHINLSNLDVNFSDFNKKEITNLFKNDYKMLNYGF